MPPFIPTFPCCSHYTSARPSVEATSAFPEIPVNVPRVMSQSSRWLPKIAAQEYPATSDASCASYIHLEPQQVLARAARASSLLRGSDSNEMLHQFTEHNVEWSSFNEWEYSYLLLSLAYLFSKHNRQWYLHQGTWSIAFQGSIFVARESIPPIQAWPLTKRDSSSRGTQSFKLLVRPQK